MIPYIIFAYFCQMCLSWILVFIGPTCTVSSILKSLCTFSKQHHKNIHGTLQNPNCLCPQVWPAELLFGFDLCMLYASSIALLQWTAWNDTICVPVNALLNVLLINNNKRIFSFQKLIWPLDFTFWQSHFDSYL